MHHSAHIAPQSSDIFSKAWPGDTSVQDDLVPEPSHELFPEHRAADDSGTEQEPVLERELSFGMDLDEAVAAVQPAEVQSAVDDSAVVPNRMFTVHTPDAASEPGNGWMAACDTVEGVLLFTFSRYINRLVYKHAKKEFKLKALSRIFFLFFMYLDRSTLVDPNSILLKACLSTCSTVLHL